MNMPAAPERPRVVVAGAGFAGMNVAHGLEADADVTLVAPTDKFVFVPLIHEVLSENVSPRDVARPLVDVLPRTRLVYGRAARVDDRELVTAAGDRIPFDVLVVAIGAEPNDFGVPGVREHALTFSTLGDSLRANATLKAAAADLHGRPLRVTVVGAGFTGVEVAGEAAELLDALGVEREIRILDALPEIFPRQSERFRAEIRKGLRRLGMEAQTGKKIVAVEEDAVVVADGDGGTTRLPTDVTVWAAGVKPRTLEGLDPHVRPTLQSAKRDDVFIAGDAARFPREMGVPLLAQTAEDEADIVVWNVLHPDEMVEYRPNVRGVIVSIGHHYAVAELSGGPVFAGDIPWHVKRLLYKAKIAFA